MTYRAVLRGYLLEEAIAWLLRNSGYRLLVDKSQDLEELETHRGSLYVKGRGADHQVDVLGEFAVTPAFSLPIRLFIEAKFNGTPCELPVVRNAHGVMHDVNENFLPGGSRPRRRYQYAYALFSASGFTHPAQDYALAQQISLVDLSGESFSWLRDAVSTAAGKLYELRNRHDITKFPVNWMRHELRDALGTAALADADPSTYPASEVITTNAPRFRAAAHRTIMEFAARLRGRDRAELLLGFPAAPFVIPLASDDVASFIAYARKRPAHAVRLRSPRFRPGDEWTLSPWPDDPGGGEAYRLTFKLPEHVQSWISERETWRSKRARAIKNDLLSYITIYHRSGSEMQIYQLRYEPSEFNPSG